MNTLSGYYSDTSQKGMSTRWFIFLIFTPDPWGDDPIFTNIFQMGVNHQLDDHVENTFVELLPLPDLVVSLIFMNLYAHI